MDTLAQALASEGQNSKAVDVMKQALAIDAKNPSLRLNYAKLLIQAGDKSTARGELNELAALGDKFPRQKEVGELLKTL
jgi:Flp pilus assembly protein TadD